ncbi:hypothetical protein M4D79_27835 [Mycolicibacterium novocastrense]|nr:hypothetical protein M4D79_27835 [Mycolicibacterium novocastrense]
MTKPEAAARAADLDEVDFFTDNEILRDPYDYFAAATPTYRPSSCAG